MKSSCEKSNTSVKFSVKFDQKDFEPARKKALERLARDIKISGFRNGKAPANVVEKHVDPNQLATTTLDILVRQTIPKLYTDAELQPISSPHVDIQKFVPGEMAEITIESDILPEVKLGDYKNLKVNYYERKINDDDVEDVLKRIADNFAETKVTKRAAQLGDDVMIDFCGKKDGVAFDGGTAKDYTLRLGSGRFIPGFEEGIVGHEVGDKFDLDITFPEDYGSKELAGQAVVFEILVKQISEVIVPAFDDELAKKTGAFKTIDELKDDIRQNLASQTQRNSDERFKDDLVRALVESSKTEAPKTLVQENLENMKADFKRNLTARGMSLDEYLESQGKAMEDWEDELRERAEQRVISSIIVQKLADELHISIGEEELARRVAEMQSVYKKSPEASAQLADPQVIENIRNRMRIDGALDKLAELNRDHAKVVEDKPEVVEKKADKKAAKKDAKAKKAKK